MYCEHIRVTHLRVNTYLALSELTGFAVAAFLVSSPTDNIARIRKANPASGKRIQWMDSR